MGCPREKILVQRMGIDPARFRFQPRARGDVFHFAAIGRFTEKKGFEYLIEAAGKLREAGAAPFRVTIAGDGQLRPGVMARATEAGLANIVSFPGPLHQDEVVALLSTADAFVAPSVTAANGDMEGIPVALMEAMASGLPVISTRHSGIPELIKDGVSGLLADERDAAGLADAMARIMADERLTRSLVDAARAGIERDYDASRLNKDLFKRLTALSQDPNP
jgi:colanic acid/amylovoran biosynthesis glycosyltransferase